MNNLVNFLLVVTITCSGNLACHFNKNKEDVMANSYKYRPKTVGNGFVDDVIFTKPDEIRIERKFEDGQIASCVTHLTTSDLGGNAWTAEDAILAFNRNGVKQAIKSGSKIYRLKNVVGNEGSQETFHLFCQKIHIQILPPNAENKTAIEAHEDLASLVYVMSKIYKQQLAREECLSLSK